MYYRVDLCCIVDLRCVLEFFGDCEDEVVYHLDCQWHVECEVGDDQVLVGVE